ASDNSLVLTYFHLTLRRDLCIASTACIAHYSYYCQAILIGAANSFVCLQQAIFDLLSLLVRLLLKLELFDFGFFNDLFEFFLLSLQVLLALLDGLLSLIE